MKKNGFMEGAIIATLAIIASKILGIVYVIPFYKIIGEQGGALYGYAYNIYNIFLIISSAGIPLAISKITSEYETKKEYDKKQAMYLVAKRVIAIFALISFLICFIFAKPIAYLILGELEGGNTISDVTFVIRCVSFALLVVPFLSISRGYLQGHKYITASSMSQVIEQFIRIAIILIGSYILIKVLNVPLVYGVGISVFSACVGAIFGYLYLIIKMRKVDKIDKKVLEKIDKNDIKEIWKKLIGYSVPFIIINIANSLYNTTDMILLIRGLKNVGYSAPDIENISSIFTTWGNKILSIIKAFATGLTISLIPSLVSAFVAKKTKEVNIYFNHALQVLIIIILPICLFMSIFSSQIWSIFYDPNAYGPIVLSAILLVCFFDSAYVLICSALQALYKTKLIYISVITGLAANLLLDLPLLYLFNNLGYYPFNGTNLATVIGYLISLGIPLIYLNKVDNISYKSTFKILPYALFSDGIIVAICLLYHKYMPYRPGYIYNIIYLGIIGLIFVGVYYLLNYKTINKLLFNKKKDTN